MTVTLVTPEPEEPDGPTFHFGNLPVRAKIIDGEPWFVAVDVAEALGLDRVRDALSALDEDEWTRILIAGPDNSDIMLYVVSEPGLYSMVMRSRKPEAKDFKRWVTREVLPAIRKTGQYVGVPRTYAEALRAAADEAERRERAELERDQAWGEATRVRAIADVAHEKIQRDAPKVGYVENFVQPAEDSCIIRVLAKELGVSERDLYAYLVTRRRIYKDPQGMYQPYASWVKWFTLRDQPEAPRLHNGQLRTTLYVTPVGKEGVRRMLEKDPGKLYG